MKKKIFLIIPSLGAGGSERVFWLISQYFNNAGYLVKVVLLNAKDKSFSTTIDGIEFIDLKTVKASRSFFKLYKLLKAEKPYAVFSTADHVNILTAMVASFLKIPHLIGRAANNPKQMRAFYGFKGHFYNFFNVFLSLRFHYIICQSQEMKQSVSQLYGIDPRKLIVIPNPVLDTPLIKTGETVGEQKKLIIVARLSKEKGLFRLLDIMKCLPENYVLTIADSGPLLAELKIEACLHKIDKRVTFLGTINNVSAEIAKHDLFVLSSFTEGFPNVVLEALAVGVPVVSFRVGGINDLITTGFNGYIADQDDLLQFKSLIIKACSQTWEHHKIKADVYKRFALNHIGLAYEKLLAS